MRTYGMIVIAVVIGSFTGIPDLVGAPELPLPPVSGYGSQRPETRAIQDDDAINPGFL
jgi:hypothetical protein